MDLIKKLLYEFKSEPEIYHPLTGVRFIGYHRSVMSWIYHKREEGLISVHLEGIGYNSCPLEYNIFRDHVEIFNYNPDYANWETIFLYSLHPTKHEIEMEKMKHGDTVEEAIENLRKLMIDFHRGIGLGNISLTRRHS